MGIIMSRIRKVRRTKAFDRHVKSIKDSDLLEKAKKHINKIIDNPLAGKPLRNVLKGERTIYVKPFRLVYSVDDDTIILLRFMHRKKAYK